MFVEECVKQEEKESTGSGERWGGAGANENQAAGVVPAKNGGGRLCGAGREVAGARVRAGLQQSNSTQGKMAGMLGAGCSRMQGGATRGPHEGRGSAPPRPLAAHTGGGGHQTKRNTHSHA